MSFLKIAFLNVGQGDTSVIYDPDSGDAVVVDCVDYLQVLRFIIARGIRRLRALIITHAHADHYSGTVGLLDALERQGILWDACLFQWHKPYIKPALLNDGDQHSQYYDSSEKQRLGIYRTLLNWAKRPANKPKHLEPHELPKGLKILDAITFCHPMYRDIQELYETGSLNNLSYTVRIQDGSSALLMGDLEPAGWQFLRTNYPGLLHNEVVKFPHHGVWRNGSVADLLTDICPQIVVISVGTSNEYGHPSKDVLSEITLRKISLLCTQATALCGKNLNHKALQINEILVRDNNFNNSNQRHNECSCAGTVIIELSDQLQWLHPRKEIHQEIISTFMETPQCRILSS